MKKSRNKLVRDLRSREEEFSKSKRRFAKKSWERFCRTYKRLYPHDEPLGQKEKEYLENLLTKMDDVRVAWYFHAMRTWTKKDYENYTKVQLWMLGEPTEDLKEAETIDQVAKILGKKKVQET